MRAQKDNFMTVLKGGCPDYVPTYYMMTSGETKPNIVLLMPPFIAEHRVPGKGGKDVWGVEYVPTESTNGASLPKPGEFILKDIRQWRDVIKAPDLSHIDWEKVAKKHLEDAKVDREYTAVSLDLHIGYFQHLMAFMGFENGMCALYEEPEECKELIQYLSDFYINIMANMIDYYEPDVISIKDDTATEHAPFLSVDMLKAFFVPHYDRQAKFGRDRGLPITFHNCGKCESYMDTLVDIGVTMWEPAQTSNNLAGIKKKFGNRLVIGGGWEPRGRLLAPDVTDEEIEESVKNTIYTLAPGGGYCFCGGYFGLPGDTESVRKSKVVNDTYMKYREAVYK